MYNVDLPRVIYVIEMLTGAEIPIIALGVRDGKKTLDLLTREGSKLYVEISIDQTQPAAPSSHNGDVNSLLRSSQSVTFSVIVFNIAFLLFR